MKKFIYSLLAILLLLAIPAITMAQDTDPPQDGCDPIDGCPVPLDTWVVLLALTAVIFGAYHLNKKQKALSA